MQFNSKKDNESLTKARMEFDAERTRQQEMQNKMVKDLNIMQKKLVEKDLIILKLTVALISVIAIFAGAIYLRIKGVL